MGKILKINQKMKNFRKICKIGFHNRAKLLFAKEGPFKLNLRKQP
jgi:hypothetical protein